MLHELTHVFQFSGVPWLRDHLSGLMREYMKTVEVRVERAAAGGLPSWPDTQKIVDAFREGGLVALVQTREQRKIMEKIQPTMSVIEGYSEHVMDAVGERVLTGYAGLREGMERRRPAARRPSGSSSASSASTSRCASTRRARRSATAWSNAAGSRRSTACGTRPSRSPSERELEHPAEWLTRVGPAPAAAA